MQPDVYETHAMWGNLTNLKVAYENVPTPPEPYLSRLKGVGEFIEFVEQFKPSDDYKGILVTEGGANQVNAVIINATQSLVNVGQDQWAQIDNAIAQINSGLPPILQNFGALLPNQTNPAIKARWTTETNRLVAEAKSARDLLSQAETQNTTRIAELEEQLTALTQQVSDAKNNLAATVGTAQNTLQGQIDEQRQAFVTATEAREAAFKDEALRRESEAENRLKAFMAHAAGQLTQQQTSAEATLRELETFKTRSEALVDTTSRNAIAGDYGAWAQKQGQAASRWSVFTVGLLIATVCLLVYLFSDIKGNDASKTSYLVLKSSITVVMLVLAGYCANQAAQHRHEERINKRTHLNLAALEPFLKEVENPEELREDVARHVFAPTQSTPARKGPLVQFGRGFTLEQFMALLNAITSKGTPHE